jgi:hypothetical protein
MRYTAQNITLKNGQQLVGVITEPPDSLTLKLVGAAETILKNNISKSETSTKLFMQDGLETILN